MKLTILLAALAVCLRAQDTTSNNGVAPVRTTVTVNATLETATPGDVTVLDQTTVQGTPGVNIDDRLRQVPGFSLFRRSSSEVANPTTQGVSLRGTGSTGASRTLVLWDGVPLNDPFGGWVYWDRLDPFYVDRVEVEEGAATSVFGDRAMSGTVSLFTQPEQHEHVWLDSIGGSFGTLDNSAGYSNLWGRWGLSVNMRGFTTDGYYITPAPVRGSADTPAGVRFVSSEVHLDYLGNNDRFSFFGDVLAEERHNGTELTHNSTGLGTVAANYTHSWVNDQLSVLAFHTQGRFNSTYSSVSLNRNTEKLTSTQNVPEYDYGGAAYWQHHGKGWNSIGGGDFDYIDGTSYDYSLTTRQTVASGGTLFQHGEFAQGDIEVGPTRWFAGLRQQFTGEGGKQLINPNAGVSAHAGDFSFHVSGYDSSRAPTLNELYRPFRVGNAQTLANSALLPEQLKGYEAGADWAHESTRLSVVLFHDSLQNLIDNATLKTTPTLILRQRENFPAALSRGGEANLVHTWRELRFQAGYIFADARLSTGLRIPQVPKQQGTAEVIYSGKKTLLSAGIRSFGLQYDDDLNQFRLPGFASIGMTAERQIGHGVSALASVDNLLDRSYLVALTPSPNTGEPRQWRVGLRWEGSLH